MSRKSEREVMMGIDSNGVKRPLLVTVDGKLIVSLGQSIKVVIDPTGLEPLLFLSYRKVGNYLTAYVFSSTYAGKIPAPNQLYAHPFFLPSKMTFDRIGINVQGAAVGKARFGIYEDDGTIYPGSLVLDAGEVDTGDIGIKLIEINQTLPKKLYWLALIANAGPTIQGYSPATMIATFIGAPTLDATQHTVCDVSLPYGPLPSTFPTGATMRRDTAFHVALRRSA